LYVAYCKRTSKGAARANCIADFQSESTKLFWELFYNYVSTVLDTAVSVIV
jgi:hypothetical protein